jgi:hypothetical protein
MMARPTAQQLPLFDAQLHSEVERLTLAYHAACEQLGALDAHCTALLRERETLQTECARLVAENRYLALQVLDVGRSPGPGRQSITPDAVDHLLRDLLKMSHPDLWSQGQPATALAHELSVAVNGLRQRFGGEKP